MIAPPGEEQEAEIGRRRRSRCAERLHVPQGYASPRRLLRPWLTACFNLLRELGRSRLEHGASRIAGAPQWVFRSLLVDCNV